MRVGGDRIDLGAGLLEFGVAVGGVFDFRRAIEGECGRHEDQHGPLALQALVGDFDELAIVERLRLERLDFGIDQRHQKVLLSRWRSEEHTSELQSLMRISYAVFCLKTKK